MSGIVEGWRWGRAGRTATAAVLTGAMGALSLVGVTAAEAAPMLAADSARSHAAPSAKQWLSSDHDAWGGVRSLWLSDVARSIKADQLPSNADGRGVDVALIDTGVSPVAGLDSPSVVANGPDLSLDYQVDAPAGVDGFGHGTHLAGIIAGRDGQNRGVARGARILNMKAGAADGAVDVSQVIASIDWVVQHKNDPGMNVRAINLSFGTESSQSYLLDPLTHAVESAWRNGIVVVVAAGNSGAALTDPATDPFVLTVGAADIGSPSFSYDDKVAPFSSVGTSARRVDLVAPGVSIISSLDPEALNATEHPEAIVSGNYIKGTGTSQAAAVVTGAVADLLSVHPNLSPDQVKSLLKATATNLWQSPQSAQGAGMLNINLAEAVARYGGLTGRQYFPKSIGLGSIEVARGGNHLLAPDGTDLVGEIDILGNPWTPTTWAPLSTAGNAWIDGTWNGGELTGLGWATASDSDGSPFTGSTWRGSTWRSEAWSGSTWRGSTWRGSTWRGSTWRGSTWRGSGLLENRLNDLSALFEAAQNTEAGDAPTQDAIDAALAAIHQLDAQVGTDAQPVTAPEPGTDSRAYGA